MEFKVLVAYASKYGSTAEIAEKIGEVLKQEGLDVDILPAKNVKNLADYKAVIIGSAVYIGQWYKGESSFLKKHEKALSAIPVWIFSTGPSGKGDPLELLKGWKYPNAQKLIVERIKPRDTSVFHGSLNADKMSSLEKWLVKRVGGDLGDFRDWDMITKWAKGVSEALKG